MAKPWHRWPAPLQSPDGPARLAIYARDNWRCAINLPGCTTRPTALDHIVAPELGGAWFDAHNLRAACKACNNKLRRGTRWKPAIKTAPPTSPSRLW